MINYRSTAFSCDHKPREIFTLGGIEYHACDRDGAPSFNGDILFNLTGQSHMGSMPDALSRHLLMKWEEVVVPWADMRVVPVKPEFWGAIHDYAESKGAKKVCLHCQAGHGRTGTALSAILITQAGYTAAEAVATIRECHCVEAVESDTQCRYLMNLEMWMTKKEYSSKVYPPPPLND